VHVPVPFLRAMGMSRIWSTWTSKFSYKNSLELSKFIGLEIVTSCNGGRLDSRTWTYSRMAFFSP